MRELTEEDAAFLAALGEEMRTQDTADQADPRFWVLMESKREACWDGERDTYEVFSSEGGSIGTSPVPFDKGDVYTVPVRKVERIAKGTLFLTLREAEEHAEEYGYNYSEPRPYAMTALRSPQVERLWELLREVDWPGLGDAS